MGTPWGEAAVGMINVSAEWIDMGYVDRGFLLQGLLQDHWDLWSGHKTVGFKIRLWKMKINII